MSRQNIETGANGELIAEKYLKDNGYKIVERNFRSKGGEVDLIAKDKEGTYVFVEVKTRSNLLYGVPQLAVTQRKQRQISKGALAWMLSRKQHDSSARFDVIAILLQDNQMFSLEHIKNAFELAY